MPGLQFSQSTDLAIHGLWALACLETGRFILLSDIASRQHVSESYLSKVFQRLTRAGLTRAMRGKRGGYTPGSPSCGDQRGRCGPRHGSRDPPCINAWLKSAAARRSRTVYCCVSLQKLSSTCMPCLIASPWLIC